MSDVFPTDDTSRTSTNEKNGLTILEAVAQGKYGQETMSQQSRKDKNISYKQKMSYCLECKKVWQAGLIRGEIDYYRNIPTYKKKREVCPLCKTDN